MTFASCNIFTLFVDDHCNFLRRNIDLLLNYICHLFWGLSGQAFLLFSSHLTFDVIISHIFLIFCLHFTHSFTYLSHTLPDSTFIHPANAHPTNAHPINAHPTNAHPTNVHPINAHPINAHPINAHPINVHPINAHPINAHPINAHPINVHPINAHPINAHPINAHPINAHPIAIIIRRNNYSHDTSIIKRKKNYILAESSRRKTEKFKVVVSVNLCFICLIHLVHATYIY